MIIYVLDDEPIALKGTIKTIKEVVPESETKGFSRARDVFEYVTENKESPDVVFSDIEMPGINGLDFAVQFKRICPETKIIFVTAYSEYALEAFRLHVHGYILKPVMAERVREELDHVLTNSVNRRGENGEKIEDSRRKDPERLQVQCFGYFEVFWKRQPLMFGRRQTKELLAYLVDRKGSACTAEEIALAMWEDEDNIFYFFFFFRILISDLRQTLKQIGQEDLVIRRSGQIAIRRDAIDCDYYKLLDGDVDAVNAFHGEYMLQYSWAEMTAGQLAFRR